MRKRIGNVTIVTVLFLIPLCGRPQQQTGFQLPDSFHFDYEVVQQVTGANKNPSGPQMITYNYTQHGDYMAIRSATDKSNNIIIYAKDGTRIIIDNQKKSITIFNMANMLSGMGNAAAQYNKKNPSGQHSGADSSNFSGGKTGKSKQIAGYQAEEYSYTNNKGEKASVWYAKMNFNTALLHQMGSGMSTSPKLSMSQPPQTPAYPQLDDPNMLVLETENSSHPGEGLTTQSITKKDLVVVTKGYTVNNLSNMMGH
jgi:hypothetical protein